MLLGIAAFAIGMADHGVTAAKCVEGPGWPPEELAEFQTLNDTTRADWPSIDKLTYCTDDDLDGEENIPFNSTELGARDLEARSGRRAWEGWSSSGCRGGRMGRVENFNCGYLFTAGKSFIYSGWLWREGTGTPYQTALYFTGAIIEVRSSIARELIVGSIRLATV